MQYMKKLNFVINVHNVKCILSGTYFCPKSIKIENWTASIKKVTKKEEPLNLNFAESSEVKNLAFPVVLMRILKTSRW